MATAGNGHEALRILTGPTASGKSAVAVCLARRMDAEIISLDSMKVYRGLDVGVAKPSEEKRQGVRFHMIDVVDAAASFSLADYLAGAEAALADIRARGKKAIFAGGTPLYLRGLLYGIFEGPGADWRLREALMRRAETEGAAALHEELRQRDPVTAERLHPNDLTRIVRALEVVSLTGQPLSERQRQYPAPAPAVPYRMAALRRSEDDLKERIRLRVERMFEQGLVEETRRALENGMNRSAQKAIGYRETSAYLAGELSLSDTVDLIRRNTWRLVRKQRSWLNSFKDVQWVDVAPEEPHESVAERIRPLLFEEPADDMAGL